MTRTTPTTEILAARGYLDAGTARWLSAWFDRLATRFPQDGDQPYVLLHGDLAPQNLLAHRHQLEALIDWGDAAWGPPGMEFAKLPLEQVAATLPTYSGDSDGATRQPTARSTAVLLRVTTRALVRAGLSQKADCWH